MAIFGKLKKAFGFSEADYEEEENNDTQRSAAVIPINRRRTAADQEQSSATDDDPGATAGGDTGQATGDTLPEISAALPDEIFDTVVRIFDDAQPSFIRDSVDPAAQRRLIYDSLSDSMKAYIEGLEKTVRLRTEIEWRDEREHLRIEMDNVRSRSKKMEDTNAEWKEQKLSAERQKRALSERVHDLEKQIVAFEAEKEQYELENKSLVNKMRAMSVHDGESAALAEENTSLREEIARLKNTAASAPETNHDAEALENLAKERDSLLNDVALLKKRCEIADAMINDLNHRASTAQKTLAERDQQLAETRAALEKAGADTSVADENAALRLEIESANADLAKTRLQLEETGDQLDKTREELDESRLLLQDLEESLGKFEEIKSSKDAAIGRLKTEIAEKQQEIDKNSAEIMSLRSTIENNLKLQASSEAALRQEIENLRNSSEYAKPRRRKRPKISSIDESLDDTDWLVATPPEGTNARPSGVSDSEFGYQEPRRKENPPENSAQMSLW